VKNPIIRFVIAQYSVNENELDHDEVDIMQYAHPIKSLFKFLQLLSQEMIEDPAFVDFIFKGACLKKKLVIIEEEALFESEDAELLDEKMCLRCNINPSSSFYDLKYCTMACAEEGDHSVFSVRTLHFLRIVNPEYFDSSSDAAEATEETEEGQVLNAD
jgi:hypothetical protein